jgi:hypothetical protein
MTCPSRVITDIARSENRHESATHLSFSRNYSIGQYITTAALNAKPGPKTLGIASAQTVAT